MSWPVRRVWQVSQGPLGLEVGVFGRLRFERVRLRLFRSRQHPERVRQPPLPPEHLERLARRLSCGVEGLLEGLLLAAQLLCDEVVVAAEFRDGSVQEGARVLEDRLGQVGACVGDVARRRRLDLFDKGLGALEEPAGIDPSTPSRGPQTFVVTADVGTTTLMTSS